MRAGSAQPYHERPVRAPPLHYTLASYGLLPLSGDKPSAATTPTGCGGSAPAPAEAVPTAAEQSLQPALEEASYHAAALGNVRCSAVGAHFHPRGSLTGDETPC